MAFIGQVPTRLKQTPEELQIHANPNCTKCWGKGYQHHSIPHKGNWLQACVCVLKRMEKNGRQLG